MKSNKLTVSSKVKVMHTPVETVPGSIIIELDLSEVANKIDASYKNHVFPESIKVVIPQKSGITLFGIPVELFIQKQEK